eukprot:gene9649-11831_t
MQQNQTENFIEKELENVCIFVPEKLQPSCNTIVQQYTSAIISSIVNKEDPHKVCQFIKFCPSSSSSYFPSLSQRLIIIEELEENGNGDDKGIGKCTLCKYLFKRIDHLINKENITDYTIIPTILDGDCKLFGEKVNKKCREMVSNKEEISIIIDAVLENNQQDPVESGVCGKISKTCSSKVSKDGYECAVCKYVVNEINMYLESNFTMQQILKLVDQQCSDIVEKRWSSICETIVSSYGPQLYRSAIAGQTPTNACAQISLCSASTSSGSSGSTSGGSCSSSASGGSGTTTSGTGSATGGTGFTSSGSSSGYTGSYTGSGLANWNLDNDETHKQNRVPIL